MGFFEDEDKKYQEEVNDVKAWWQDSRWRYTKRPFTAEQIVAKRGTMTIDYPSNVQAKKLWGILEHNFKVRVLGRLRRNEGISRANLCALNRTRSQATPMAVSNLPWSPRWPSTSTPFTYRAGKALPPLRQPTNPPPTLQTTLW